MKLKYYLRGIGIGVILTALIMGFALGGRKTTISDAEVIERAKKLGMVQGGVLSDYSNEDNSIDNKDDSSSSDTEVSEEGKEISKENDEAVTLSSSPISKVATPKAEAPKEEEKSSSAVSSTDKSDVVSDASKKDEAKATQAKAESKSDNSNNTDLNKKEDTSKKEEEPKKEEESKKEESAQNDAPSEEAKAPQSENAVSKEAKTINIPGGMSSDAVARILQNEGVIDDAVSFNKYLVDSRKDRIIRSGTKNIPAGATYEDIASIITR